MAEVPKSGDYGGGYLKVQRHWRTAVMSVGFALVTTTPFTANLAVPSISQAQLTGYKYPARTVRQTEPQQGWIYTASLPFDPTVSVAPVEQSQVEGYRAPRRPARQTEPQPVYDLWGTYSPAIDNESNRPAKKPWRGHTEVQDGWLYTAATVDPTATVAAIGQSQLTGYRYPAHTVRQTDSQDGWFYETLPVVWDESKFQNNSGDRTPAAPATRYRYADYPGTDWIYQNLPVADVWDESKFQNISGDMTPIRAALKFRYPLASAGFSTDGSTPDAWDESKFQNIGGDRTPTRKALLYRYDGYPATDWIYQNLPVPEVWDESKFQNIQADRMQDRRQYDPRYEYHKFPFGLVDARVVMPAIDQLANSERAAKRTGVPIVTPDSLGWLYENLPVVFDPQYLIHSDDSRMRERYKKVPPLDQPAQDWIFTAVPPFDPQYLIQVSAPTRMADREKLDVRLAQFYNDMAWLRDVLSLPDPPAQGTVTRRHLTVLGVGY